MSKRYSIAGERHDLSAIVHEAAQNGPVELTQRGETVAILLTLDDYKQLVKEDFDFREAYYQFRASANFEALDIGPEIFDVRDDSPGREEVAY